MMGPGGDKVGRRIGQFVTTKWIGSGGFGHVYLAKNVEDHQEYAVKILDKKEIDKHPEMKRLLQTEVGVMGDIDHPNILKLKEFLESSKNYYIVMQYCNNGDFESYLSKQPKNYLEEKEALYFLKQIMNGFQVLRQKEVMHRDFKLANIFLNDKTLVIGDFGFAKAGFEMAQTNVGTPLTKAPELHKNVTTYNSKADLWSIGVVFYQLLYGTYPFYALSILELMHQIESYSGNNVRFPDHINLVSDKVKDLIKGLLQPDPDKRIAWEDFFKHPVFDDDDNKGLLKKELVDSIVGTEEIDDEFKKNQSLSKQAPELGEKPPANGKGGELAPITIVESGPVGDSQISKSGSTGFQTNGSLDASSASKDGPVLQPPSQQIQSTTVSPQGKGGTGSPPQFGILRQIKDIAARYNHERNKILMILMTAGRLRHMMKEAHFESANKNLYLLISLLTKKGSMLSELTLMSLKMQNNIFKQKDFEEFCKSEDYTEVCTQLAKDQKEVFEYRDHITNLRSKVATSEEDNVLLSQIGQGYVDLKFLDEKALRAFERTRLLDQVVLKMQTEQTRYNYFLTMILVIYAIKSEYYIQFVQDGQRFDWDVFKIKYKNTNSSALWTILSTLTKEIDIQVATK